MVHAGLPTHAAATIAVELAALHVPVAKPLTHVPDGVPKDANVTADTVPPDGHVSVAGAFSGAAATHALGRPPSEAISAAGAVPAGNGRRTSATVLGGTVAVSEKPLGAARHSTATVPRMDSNDPAAYGSAACVVARGHTSSELYPAVPACCAMPATSVKSHAPTAPIMMWLREFMPGPSVGPFHSSHLCDETQGGGVGGRGCEA